MPSMTADHHRQRTGLRYRLENESRQHPPSGIPVDVLRSRGCGYSSGFPRVRRLRRRVRRRRFLLRAGSRSRPASSPAARPRIWRPSRSCREPCWISHWSAAIGRSDMPCREFHPRVRFRQTPPGACRSMEIPRFPPDSPNALTVPFMKGSRPHQTQRPLRVSWHFDTGRGVRTDQIVRLKVLFPKAIHRQTVTILPHLPCHVPALADPEVLLFRETMWKLGVSHHTRAAQSL